MALAPAQSIIETRRAQMFPTLETSDIERMRRFGTMASYAAGEALLRVGEPGVDLVDGDQLAVPGIAGEERAGPAAAFEDGVVATVPLQQCGELQTGRSRADDQVVVRHGGERTEEISELSEIDCLPSVR